MSRERSLHQESLPGDWCVVEVSQLGAVVSGGTPRRDIPHYWNGDIPWVTPGELTHLREKNLDETAECITKAGLESCGAQLLPPGSLLVTSRATLGSVALVQGKASTNQGFKSIVFGRGICPDFYYHLFRYLGRELRRRASGTTFLEISGREFSAIRVPKPELREQSLIAEILDTVNEAIRETEQLIAKNRLLKEGLLHDLLTRGIDKNGELRDPERHPEQFKDSALGRIPRDWSCQALGAILLSAVDGPFGTNLKTEHYVSEPGVRLVRLQNIGTGFFSDSDQAWISEGHAATLARHEVQPGDLLVASLGDERHPFGRACMFPLKHSAAIVKADCFRLRCNPTQADASYIMHTLNTPIRRRGLLRLVQGVTRDRINLRNLLRFTVALPSLAEQEGIRCGLLAVERREAAEIDFLAELRFVKSGLMDDLLTGRVRVTRWLEGSSE